MKTKTRRCTFDKRANTIDIQPIPDSGYVYQVDLDDCASSKGVLDYIHQIHQKSWGPDIMEEFLEVLFSCIPTKLWCGGA